MALSGARYVRASLFTLERNTGGAYEAGLLQVLEACMDRSAMDRSILEKTIPCSGEMRYQ